MNERMSCCMSYYVWFDDDILENPDDVTSISSMNIELFSKFSLWEMGMELKDSNSK